MTAAASTTPAAGANLGRIALTSLAASSIEWYDFFIYGTAAALVFPKLFFAASLSPAVAQLAAFSTFAVGFIARPIGGMVFAHFGDLVGRKKALVAALLLMGLATTGVGLLPTYAVAGVAAPILLVVLRFLQGLAVGGQWGGAVLLAIESAPPGRRGLFGSFAQMGVPVGVILANLIFLVMGAVVAPDAFLQWAWRVPFLLSLLLVGLGLYVQIKLEDTAEFVAMQEAEAGRNALAVKAHAEARGVSIAKATAQVRGLAQRPREILLAAGSIVATNGVFYVMITFTVAYATGTLHVARSTVLWAVLIGSVCNLPLLPLSAWLSDKVGRRGVFMSGAILMALWAAPFFLLVDTGRFPFMVAALVGGQACLSLMYGCQAALLTELFSTEFRYSGASLGYQFGAIFGGGFAPMISTALLARFGTSMAVSGYVALMCLVSLVSVFLLAETNGKAHRAAVMAQGA